MVMPPPGTLDFESTKCAYVEFPAADLPWRYTPERVDPLDPLAPLRPWLVLVTARPGAGEVTLQTGGKVTLTGAALTSHDLTRSARWAHVQEDADNPGPRRARLLSPRPLEPESEYVAALVPAFTADGQSSWTAATGSITCRSITGGPSAPRSAVTFRPWPPASGREPPTAPSVGPRSPTGRCRRPRICSSAAPSARSAPPTHGRRCRRRRSEGT